jgi:hypothetical protein
MTSSTIGGAVTSSPAVSVALSAYEPGADATTVTLWVPECCVAHPSEGAVSDAVAVDESSASVPDDGVTDSPAGCAATCQPTVDVPVSAGATPISIAAGFPTVTDTAPLGDVNPTTGDPPFPKDGGLSASADPHVGSGVPESE